jgi:hypothetical protein
MKQDNIATLSAPMPNWTIIAVADSDPASMDNSRKENENTNDSNSSNTGKSDRSAALACNSNAKRLLLAFQVESLVGVLVELYGAPRVGRLSEHRPSQSWCPVRTTLRLEVETTGFPRSSLQLLDFVRVGSWVRLSRTSVANNQSRKKDLHVLIHQNEQTGNMVMDTGDSLTL